MLFLISYLTSIIKPWMAMVKLVFEINYPICLKSRFFKHTVGAKEVIHRPRRENKGWILSRQCPHLNSLSCLAIRTGRRVTSPPPLPLPLAATQTLQPLWRGGFQPSADNLLARWELTGFWKNNEPFQLHLSENGAALSASPSLQAGLEVTSWLRVEYEPHEAWLWGLSWENVVLNQAWFSNFWKT